MTKTQEKILTASRDLFLARGYPATTIDEIVEKAGVSKGSFYHAFPSKEEMGLVLLEWYQLGGVDRLMSGPFSSEKDPLKRMFGFLDHIENISKDMWGHGCLLGNLGLELAESSPKIRQKVSHLFQNVLNLLEPIFEPAGRSPERQNHPTAREIAEHYLIIFEGAIMMALVYKDWGYFSKGLNGFRDHLKFLTA